VLGFVKFPGGNKAEKMKVNRLKNEIEWVIYSELQVLLFGGGLSFQILSERYGCTNGDTFL
jgi:hypothetical protein